MPAGGPGLPPAAPPSEESPSIASRGDLVLIGAEVAAGLDHPRTAFRWFRHSPCGLLHEPTRTAVPPLLLRSLPLLARPV